MAPIDLYFEVHGETGYPVLLMHGFLSSRAHWIPNLPALIDNGFRPIVLELLGHGNSNTPDAPEQYHPQHYVQQFEAIRETLGIERWLLCGQSLGAALVLNYAYTCPERTTALAFTNSRAVMMEPTERKEALEAFQREVAEKGQRIIAESPMNPARSRRLRADIKALLMAHNAQMSLSAYENAMCHTVPYAGVKHRLKDNTCPVLHVFGQRERTFQADRDYIAEHMANCQVVDLEHAGHAVNLDDAEGFNQAVITFFKKQI